MDITCYKGIYKDVYLLHKKYAERMNTDDDFEEFHQDMIALSKQYGDTKFVIDFLVTVGTELEREFHKDSAKNK